MEDTLMNNLVRWLVAAALIGCGLLVNSVWGSAVATGFFVGACAGVIGMILVIIDWIVNE